MPTPKPPVEVRVGQVWADKDPRSVGRHVRIVRMDSRHVYAERVYPAGSHFLPDLKRKAPTRILWDHRGVRGYRLASRPDGGVS